ncbi:xanthine dehydrogenase accessory factor [Clostridium saccharoperbutylacetonicum]|uniref:Putative xanthine dehydrogenase subunit A n=1 Tax=Clostridium saccharoperbutylacetonicum N1-4(HMT) TaxID=931276 RepID=M1LNR7_9CLOT|nr:XdhC/CoxI family protein [Clostridium saccharoperbutylacetonicum]AGF54480.1 putative xanthine dehydrogenase subunit A [Clostridium saccharoperbutylacetonicum N1-4(HMT)]NRT59000.1 xanthine dehydrogenase accessory factor [Clostridium saccharoperbutylacetonicum]NSB28188.1 xanthine dehydrogenase accessory factor [Clostridium saccharoperbutylacetonicum]NSB41676.1 xanthine dehydrogenase accessory factor [Clostridium saccharoperbutylacetonicum]
MKEFYEERLELLKNNESFILASIFDSQGSAPRTTGARMIIKKDGSILGTVGGGKVEALVIQHGIELFNTKETVLKEYKLQETENKGIGMACGGDVRILMEYVDAQKLQLYEKVVNCFKNGEKAFIIRKFFNDGNNINYIYKDGQVIFSSEHIEEDEIKKYSEEVRYRDLLLIKENDSVVLIEPICNLGRLYIFGAGHVSQKLAELAKKIDFLVTVVDYRAEFANTERFPSTDDIIVPNSFEGCFDKLPIDKDSYIVIVTSGHLFDLTCLKQALRTEAYYIGMIGSRRKRNIVYEVLKEEGFTVEDFNKVHNPIGLEIGAETPEEISVSIAAELIKVRRERML